jgi:hypothetical protein
MQNPKPQPCADHCPKERPRIEFNIGTTKVLSSCGFAETEIDATPHELESKKDCSASQSGAGTFL